MAVEKQIYFRIICTSHHLSGNDDTSKKVVDYNIIENQFAIEYTAIFEDGTYDSCIENKVIETAERLPFWVEDIKEKEKSKKEKSNNS